MSKILFISINDHVPWGGSEILWSKTAVKLSNKYEVVALLKKWDNEPGPASNLRRKGVNLIYKSRGKRTLIDKVLKRFLRINVNKKHELEKEGAENTNLVILSTGFHLDTQLVYYAEYLIKHQIPFVIIFQLVTDLRGALDGRFTKFLEILPQAERLFFLSQENVDKFETQVGCKFNNTTIINNPFNTQQNIVAYEGNTENYYLGLVAAFNTYHKGQDVLLKVLSSNKWKKRNLKLNLYGNGHNERLIKRIIEMFELSDHVHIKGYMPNKSLIWKENHALILPSRMEGQSLAMLEAMSFGRMVISTKVGDAERLVKDGKTGFLIEAATEKLIDEGLERAWANRELWLEMGKQSKLHLHNEIKVDPVESFSEIIDNLVNHT